MAKTNALIIKMAENAPVAGNANSNNPNAIERTAISANSHSPLISSRNLTAVINSNTPVIIAQNAISKSAPMAVSPGQMSIMAPTTMLTTPSNNSAHQRSRLTSRPEASITAKIPLIIAYTPKSGANTHNVMWGHINAAIPNSAAANPRSAIAHLFTVIKLNITPPYYKSYISQIGLWIRGAIDMPIRHCGMRPTQYESRDFFKGHKSVPLRGAGGVTASWRRDCSAN